MATAHLISGLPCSGKTTYAETLAEETGGVLFSLDFWLITLHGRYSLDEVEHAEHVRRVFACRQIIAGLACELLRRGIDVILDDGFFLREHRLRHVTEFGTAEAAVITHVVRAPMEALRARVARRNQSLPAHNFAISPERLQRFIELYEEPSEAEGAELVRVTAAAIRAAPPGV